MMKYLIAAFVAVPLAAAAQPAPRAIADCEKIKSDMAYNQCLASFGPKVGARAPRVQAGQDPESSIAERPSRRSRYTVRGRRGRQVAAFDVVSGGSRQKARATKTYRRHYSRRRR